MATIAERAAVLLNQLSKLPSVGVVRSPRSAINQTPVPVTQGLSNILSGTLALLEELAAGGGGDFLPRDGSLPMFGHLVMGGQDIEDADHIVANSAELADYLDIDGQASAPPAPVVNAMRLYVDSLGNLFGKNTTNTYQLTPPGMAGAARIVVINDAASLALFTAFVAAGGVTIGFLQTGAPALPSPFTVPDNSTVVLMGRRDTALWNPTTTTTVGINAQLVLDGLTVNYAPTTITDPMFLLDAAASQASGAVYLRNARLTSTSTGALFQGNVDNSGAGVFAAQAIEIKDSDITHAGSFALSTIPNGFTGAVRIINSSVKVDVRFEVPGVGGYGFNGGPGNALVFGSFLRAKQFKLGSNNLGRGVEALGSTFTILNADADPSAANTNIDFQSDNQASTYKQCVFDFQYTGVVAFGVLTYLEPFAYTTGLNEPQVSWEDCTVTYSTPAFAVGANAGFMPRFMGRHNRTRMLRATAQASSFDSIVPRLGGVLVDCIFGTGNPGGGTGPYAFNGIAGVSERRLEQCQIDGEVAYTEGQTACLNNVFNFYFAAVLLGIHYFEDNILNGFGTFEVILSSTPA